MFTVLIGGHKRYYCHLQGECLWELGNHYEDLVVGGDWFG
jgi:hypothetical protein